MKMALGLPVRGEVNNTPEKSLLYCRLSPLTRPVEVPVPVRVAHGDAADDPSWDWMLVQLKAPSEKGSR